MESLNPQWLHPFVICRQPSSAYQAAVPCQSEIGAINTRSGTRRAEVRDLHPLTAG
jgi:hypothetical protein